MLRIPEIPEDASVLDAALAYAAAGWYVGPAKKGSKNPGSVLGKGWESKTSSDPEQIVAWFAGSDHDVFLHAGRSGAVLIDVDYFAKVPAVLAAHLGDTPFQSSRPNEPGRGHYPFLRPPGRFIGNGTGKLGSAWGQVRGENGVVIAQPSCHAEGGEYRWVRTGPVPPLPADIDELLPEGKPGEDAASDEEVRVFVAKHTTASRPVVLDGRLKGYRESLAAGKGRHDTTVPNLAGAMEEARAGFFSAQAAVDALWPIFLEAVIVGPRARNEDRARGEFAGILSWAVAQALAADLEAVRARVNGAMPDHDEILRKSAKPREKDNDAKKGPRVWRSDELTASAPLDWLGVGHIPEAAVTLLTGDEGIGKSLLWVHIAAAVTTGSALPEFGIPAREPRHVLVIVTEDDWSSTVRPRLELAGADMDLVGVLCSEPDGSGSPYFPRDINIVAAAQPVPYLIVLDAWADTVEGNLSIRDAQQARIALHPWREVANKLRSAVLLLTHTNRATGGSIRERYAMTSELRKKARMALFAQQDEDGNLVVGPDKSNLVGKVPASVFTIEAVEVFKPTESSDGTVPRLVFVKNADFTAAELLTTMSAPPPSDGAQGFAQTTLAAMLAGGQAHDRAEVISKAAAAGIPERTAERAAKELGVVKKRNGFGGTSTWQLPVPPIVPPSEDAGANGANEEKSGANRNGDSRAADWQQPAETPVAPNNPSVAPLPPTETDGTSTGANGAVEQSENICGRCGLAINPAFGPRHPFCES